MKETMNDPTFKAGNSLQHAMRDQEPAAVPAEWDFDAYSEPPSRFETYLQSMQLSRCTSDSAVERRRSSWLPPDIQKLVSVFTCKEVIDLEEMFAGKPNEKSLMEPEDSKQFTQVLA
mmetsp:Transcript_3699/g.9151  ORF Transcript_3699/g.9151 Transcript_3699/m.9151 type:complete len:117 (+) Transcript_3699:265-615(+)